MTDEAPNQSYFFRLSMDGELLAEAPIIVHDEAKAWKAFMAVYAVMTQNLLGEFFETMRVACDPELRAKTGNKPGFTVDLQTKPKPKVYLPIENGSKQPVQFPGQ